MVPATYQLTPESLEFLDGVEALFASKMLKAPIKPVEFKMEKVERLTFQRFSALLRKMNVSAYISAFFLFLALITYYTALTIPNPTEKIFAYAMGTLFILVMLAFFKRLS
jgi:hypothetical protein